MKHKPSKRSISNKQPHHRSYQIQPRRLSIPIDHIRTISPNQIEFGTGTAQLDTHTPCLKQNLAFKNEKSLKRDLLRCSNQRPSLLGSQILQPSRAHHGAQQTHSVVSSSSTTSSFDRRRRSLSVNSHTFSTTIDRIGPWPDISIGRLRSDGNDLLRPLKNVRNMKNPRLFSPKYYAGLNDNTSKFQFHPSTRTYMEEYRKQKGYLLIPRSIQRHQPTSLSLSSSQLTDDDQLSAIGTFSGGAGNCTARERSELSITNLSLSTEGITKTTDDLLNNNNNNNHLPIISSVTNQINSFPAIAIRNSNNYSRAIRNTPHHQPITLPALTTSSFQYLDSINSLGKAYGDHKKVSKANQSKLYIIDGRQKKRSAPHISYHSEVTSRAQDYSGLRTTGSAIVIKTERSPAIVFYQLSHRTQIVATQHDIKSLI